MLRKCFSQFICNKDNLLQLSNSHNKVIQRFRASKGPLGKAAKTKYVIPEHLKPLTQHYKEDPDPEIDEKNRQERIKQIEDFINNIDTTLTDEQKEYVAKLKRHYKGARAKPSLFRDVPTPDQVQPQGNYISLMAPNPEKMIDYVLSKVPKATGPRGTRKKRRMQLRLKARQMQHDKRKAETKAAELRKKAKRQKQKELCIHYYNLAKEINAKRAEEKAQKLAQMNGSISNMGINATTTTTTTK